MRTILPLLLLVLFSQTSTLLMASETDLPTGALVRVHVTYQMVDPFLPWQYQAPGSRTGYGVAVETNMILTTENMVRGARLVQLQRPESGEKIKAIVQAVDSQVNLALLVISTDSLQTPFTAVRSADKLDRHAPVTIMQMDDTGALQNESARVLQVSMTDLPSAPYACLSATVMSDLNITGEGVPAVQENRLAGMMMSYDASTRTGLMLPAPIINRFLNDALNPPYEGFASAGFIWTPLVDPVKRNYLGIPGEKDMQGILILSCLPGTGASQSLRPNDVVLEWDGFVLDNLGFYNDPEFGRMQMSYLIKGRRKPGDLVPAVVIRDGKQSTITVKLTNWSDSRNLIPENFAGDPVPFLVEGGYVLMKLTGRYLRAFGANWERTVDPRLVQKYLFERHLAETPGQRVVILAGVLPDPFNIGFDQFRNAIVTAINGKPVTNMQDVFSIMDADRGLFRITLKSVGVDIVLDPEKTAEANERLATQYRIPFLRLDLAPALPR